MKIERALRFHGLGLFGIDGTPAGFGDDLASECGAGAGLFARLWLIERAVDAFLLGLVHRVFRGVHLGGVFFVTERRGDWIALLKLDGWWRCLGEGMSGPEGGHGGGDGEFAQKIATGVHDFSVKVV